MLTPDDMRSFAALGVLGVGRVERVELPEGLLVAGGCGLPRGLVHHLVQTRYAQLPAIQLSRRLHLNHTVETVGEGERDGLLERIILLVEEAKGA